MSKYTENRKVRSYRVKPSVNENMHIIRKHLSINTDFFNNNIHTYKLGCFSPSAVFYASDRIAINDLYNKLFPERN